MVRFPAGIYEILNTSLFFSLERRLLTSLMPQQSSSPVGSRGVFTLNHIGWSV
jgi:hypothetical protein